MYYHMQKPRDAAEYAGLAYLGNPVDILKRDSQRLLPFDFQMYYKYNKRAEPLSLCKQ